MSMFFDGMQRMLNLRGYVFLLGTFILASVLRLFLLVSVFVSLFSISTWFMQFHILRLH